jgi:phosphoglycolate phosphatase-like HAD superfamily hydrolase
MEDVFKIEGIQTTVFDFDGTIANTMPFLSRLAVELITKAYFIEEKEALKRYRETTGLRFACQLEVIFPNHPMNRKVAKTFEQKKRKEIFKLPLFADVISTFTFLKSCGIKRFICSSTDEELVKEYCKMKGLWDLVDGVFGYKAGFEKFTQLAFLIENCGLNPKEVLFIGDSLKDYEFAKDKGIEFIGITGMFSKEEFQKKGARAIDGLCELRRLLKG